MPTSRSFVLLSWLLAALALIAAGVEAAALWEVQAAHPAAPRWDMAGHGWQGVELLTDLRAGRPLAFLLDLNAQDKWPFGFSLLLMPFLALGGATFESARLLSLVGWVAVAPLTVLAARRIQPGAAGLLGGALAAVLWLGAPLERVLALVILRETVSLALLLLALILYLRARERESVFRESLSSWRAAGLATLALVLVKYNYALIWGLAVVLDELRRMSSEERGALVRRLRELLTPWGDKPLSRRLLAGALDLVLLAAVIGVNPGVAIWLGLGVAAVVVAVRTWRGRIAPRAWLRDLPARRRAAVETVGLPIALWWLSPDPIHPKTIYSFLRNESGGSERAPFDLLYYWRSYLADYLPLDLSHPGWGIALLGLAGVACWMAFRRVSRLSFLAILTLLGLVLITLHPHKEARFAATTLPLLTLLGALGLGRLLVGSGSAGRGRLVLGTLAGALVVLGAAYQSSLGVLETRERERLVAELSLYTGDPHVLPLLEPLAQRVGPGGRLGVVGVLDELSTNLVRWALAREHGGAMPEVDAFRKRFDPQAPREAWWPRLDRWMVEERLDRLLVLHLEPGSPWAERDDFRLHNAWQGAAAAALLATLPRQGPGLEVPEIGLTATVIELLPPSQALLGIRQQSAR